ncbi:MAG: adhesin/invasin, partial [Halothiobacillaceae bacterium]
MLTPRCRTDQSYPKLLSWWLLFSIILMLLGCGGGSNDARVTSLSLTASGSSLDTGTTHYVVLTALVRDAEDLLLPAVTVEFSTTLGRLEASSVTTNIQGEAKVKFFAENVAGVATITAFVSGYQKRVTVQIESTAQSNSNVDSLLMTALSKSLPADGMSTTAIDLVLTDNDDNLLSGRQIQLTTNAGTLHTTLAASGSSTINVATDGSGSARVFLKSGVTSSTALIRASSEGINATTTITFAPGVPDTTNSSLTAAPSTIPANGSDTTQVTVLLLDANNNLVADGTKVTLQATAGDITTENPQTVRLGRALFTLRAPTSASSAVLSLLEYSGITARVTFGSSSSANPSNIRVAIAAPSMFVAGVGKQDNTSLTLTVETAAGNLIANAAAGVNNLRVRFKTKPNGGEKLIGTDANLTIVESDTQIAVRTVSGVATLTLQAGSLPGIIELEAEALNSDGTTPATPVITTISQVTIASGPPHNIVLSYPVQDSIEDLGAGIYRRIGSASVTDRYGNSVPDGTAISLGLLDSVIASNRAPSPNGSVTDNNATITA